MDGVIFFLQAYPYLSFLQVHILLLFGLAVSHVAAQTHEGRYHISQIR